MSIIHALDLFGVAVFSISGALTAGRKHMDVFGVFVLSFVTALGGGSLRDLLIDSGPVFWISDSSYVMMVAVTSLLTIFFTRMLTVTGPWLLVSDALGLAVFTMIGTQKTYLLTGSGSIAVIMGITTGVAGGVIRDILSAEVPLVLQREIYATAAFCGALAYIVLNNLGVPEFLSTPFAICVTLFIGLAAIHWKLALPVPVYKGKNDES